MSVQHFKVIGFVAVFLGLVGGLVFAVRWNSDPLVIGALSTAIGSGAAIGFRWFSAGDDGKAGPLAVLLVSGTIAASGGGCLPAAIPPEVAAATAEDAYKADQKACVDANETRETIEACRQAVREAWGVSAKDGGR